MVTLSFPDKDVQQSFERFLGLDFIFKYIKHFKYTVHKYTHANAHISTY